MTYNYDPELVQFVELLPEPDVSSTELSEMEEILAARKEGNEMIIALSGEADETGVVITDHVVDGKGAAAGAIPVRVYAPRTSGGLVPGLLSIHGGGFWVGNIETEHGHNAMLSRELGIVVVSVDYRLAPEHPFPAGLEDCYSALLWIESQSESLGIDMNRLGVFGQSAGGGLSAATALLARDRKGPQLCFQYLGMPELDDRLETASMRQFTDTPVWSRSQASQSWDYYLGKGVRGGVDVSPYAAPARATDLSGLPPAFITAMQYDPLRDEDIAYAQKLLGDGVTTELVTYPGTFHGSGAVVTAAVSQRQAADLMDALRRGLKV